MKFADLHLHTIYSDGTLDVPTLIKQANSSGLDCIAITDHDTVEAVEEALNFIELGKLELIPAIELTAEYNNQEIHILGYFIDHTNEELKERLDFLRKNRKERIYKMIERLRNLGVEISIDTVLSLAGKSVLGRMHLARALVKEGKVSSIYEAFKKYLGENGPAYILGFKFGLSEAINLIKKCRGIAVLAHPYITQEKVLLEIIREGIEGLEIYYPEHTPALINYYLDIANRYNLLVTGGSDFHGELKPEVKIGLIKIPYNLVERLKDAKKRR